jgi:mRNA interferase MazF
VVKRGEIRWYKFKVSDKRRPVLILTRDSHLTYLREVIIAPITSAIRDIPSQVLLTDADGMPKDCAVSLDHLRIVDKDKLGALITTLDDIKLARVKRALLYALGY